jgi:hypothetical protein
MKQIKFTEGHAPLNITTLSGDEAVVMLQLMGVGIDHNYVGVAYGYCGQDKLRWIALTGGTPLLYLLDPDSNEQQREAFQAVAEKAGREIDRMNCCGNN